MSKTLWTSGHMELSLESLAWELSECTPWLPPGSCHLFVAAGRLGWPRVACGHGFLILLPSCPLLGGQSKGRGAGQSHLTAQCSGRLQGQGEMESSLWARRPPALGSLSLFVLGCEGTLGSHLRALIVTFLELPPLKCPIFHCSCLFSKIWEMWRPPRPVQEGSLGAEGEFFEGQWSWGGIPCASQSGLSQEVNWKNQAEQVLGIESLLILPQAPALTFSKPGTGGVGVRVAGEMERARTWMV